MSFFLILIMISRVGFDISGSALKSSVDAGQEGGG